MITKKQSKQYPKQDTENVKPQQNIHSENNIETIRERNRRKYHESVKANPGKLEELNLRAREKRANEDDETKQARRAKKREYRAKNKQKIIEKEANYRAKPETKEKLKQYKRTYRAKPETKDKEKETRTKYNLKNKDKINQQRRHRVTTFDGVVTVIITTLKNRYRSRKHLTPPNVDRLFVEELLKNALINQKNLISLETHSPQRASLDQIKPGAGYLRDNVQIIPAWLNYAYNDYDKEEVNIEIIKYAEYLKFIKPKDVAQLEFDFG